MPKWQLVELLNVLLERHLPRIIAAQQQQQGSQSGGAEAFPVGELLSLLAAFTFQQRDTEGLRRCLVPWGAFAAMVTEEEDGGSGMAALAQQVRSAHLPCLPMATVRSVGVHVGCTLDRSHQWRRRPCLGFAAICCLDAATCVRTQSTHKPSA
jgi:hypothetical protein